MAAAHDLLDRARIDEVRAALGLPEPRHWRIPATWRNGVARSVSINPSKNCWYDFVTGAGGGVLTLIEVALGCTRKDAFRWLADHYGIPLDRPLSAADRRQYARRREKARRLAADVTAWRRARIREIIDRCNDCHDTDALLCRLALLGLRGCIDLTESDWVSIFAYSQELSTEAQQLDTARDRLEQASTPDLVAMWRAA